MYQNAKDFSSRLQGGEKIERGISPNKKLFRN
jgi:hypothetical protein